MTDLEFRASFPPLIRDFARYKDVVQGCSAKTVNEYLLDLRTFCRWLTASRAGLPTEGEEFEAADLTGLDTAFFEGVGTGEIYDFLAYVKEGRDNENRTVARKLSAIKQFYKFCVSRQHLFENNPAGDIETPKLKKTLPKYLSVEESVSLLDAVSGDAESKTRERDYCILTLFLNCGIRLSELAGISLPDLDRELRSMRVIGKGSKERIVYLNDACRAAISAYLPVRMQTPAKQKGESALFLSGQGHRISVKTVQWMVKKYLGEAGLEYKNYSTHKLRHTAATLMYQSGEVDIRVLKDILGHEQLNTTQIYTHVSNEHMEEAMQNNPLSSLRPKKRPAAEIPEDEEDGE
ncbi:MAG: tyrosine recombinase XerC [Clostridia bacterium]|nr:tyrosine recombinase XerC [Clostridia bacterium]